MANFYRSMRWSRKDGTEDLDSPHTHSRTNRMDSNVASLTLISIFWNHNQFDSYILETVNLVFTFWFRSLFGFHLSKYHILVNIKELLHQY